MKLPTSSARQPAAGCPIIIDLNKEDTLSERTDGIFSVTSTGLEDLRSRIKLFRQKIFSDKIKDEDWSPGTFPYDENWIRYEKPTRSVGVQCDRHVTEISRGAFGTKVKVVILPEDPC